MTRRLRGSMEELESGVTNKPRPAGSGSEGLNVHVPRLNKDNRTPGRSSDSGADEGRFNPMWTFQVVDYPDFYNGSCDELDDSDSQNIPSADKLEVTCMANDSQPNDIWQQQREPAHVCKSRKKRTTPNTSPRQLDTSSPVDCPEAGRSGTLTRTASGRHDKTLTSHEKPVTSLEQEFREARRRQRRKSGGSDTRINKIHRDDQGNVSLDAANIERFRRLWADPSLPQANRLQHQAEVHRPPTESHRQQEKGENKSHKPKAHDPGCYNRREAANRGARSPTKGTVPAQQKYNDKAAAGKSKDDRAAVLASLAAGLGPETERKVEQLLHQLTAEQQAVRRERLAVAKLQRETARHKSDVQMRETVMKELQEERLLRASAEERLRDLTKETSSDKDRLKHLQSEFQRLERMVAGLPHYKAKVDQIKAEKTALLVSFETEKTQLNSKIQTLERENRTLTEELQQLQQQVTTGACGRCVRDEDSRVKQLEKERDRLMQEADQTRVQYDSTLQQLVPQVMHAVSSHKALRDDCNRLQMRVLELEKQNRALNAAAKKSVVEESQTTSSRALFTTNTLGSMLSFCSDTEMDEFRPEAKMSSPPPWLRDSVSQLSSPATVQHDSVTAASNSPSSSAAADSAQPSKPTQPIQLNRTKMGCNITRSTEEIRARVSCGREHRFGSQPPDVTSVGGNDDRSEPIYENSAVTDVQLRLANERVQSLRGSDVLEAPPNSADSVVTDNNNFSLPLTPSTHTATLISHNAPQITPLTTLSNVPTSNHNSVQNNYSVMNNNVEMSEELPDVNDLGSVNNEVDQFSDLQGCGESPASDHSDGWDSEASSVPSEECSQTGSSLSLNEVLEGELDSWEKTLDDNFSVEDVPVNRGSAAVKLARSLVRRHSSKRSRRSYKSGSQRTQNTCSNSVEKQVNTERTEASTNQPTDPHIYANLGEEKKTQYTDSERTTEASLTESTSTLTSIDPLTLNTSDQPTAPLSPKPTTVSPKAIVSPTLIHQHDSETDIKTHAVAPLLKSISHPSSRHHTPGPHQNDTLLLSQEYTARTPQQFVVPYRTKRLQSEGSYPSFYRTDVQPYRACSEQPPGFVFRKSHAPRPTRSAPLSPSSSPLPRHRPHLSSRSLHPSAAKPSASSGSMPSSRGVVPAPGSMMTLVDYSEKNNPKVTPVAYRRAQTCESPGAERRLDASHATGSTDDGYSSLSPQSEPLIDTKPGSNSRLRATSSSGSSNQSCDQRPVVQSSKPFQPRFGRGSPHPFRKHGTAVKSSSKPSNV